MQSSQTRLFDDIPITKIMGVQLVRYNQQGLVISAPLAANINDKQTAFAGSLATVITLSGWALTTLILDDAGLQADVMIAHSDINYRKPITQDFHATCNVPDDDTIQQFIRTLEKRGKARWTLNATIAAGDSPAVTFTGSFVAILKT